jgi:hypothetical protein
MNTREKAMQWWNNLTFEEQFYKTIEANSVIEGDRTRNPNSLTGREIEKIYEYAINK